MEQCNGVTLKGTRCKRNIKKSADNTIGGNAYCHVHYTKIIYNQGTDINNVQSGNNGIPNYLKEIIPADILQDLEMFPVEEIEYIFAQNYNEGILNKTDNENKIPNYLLKIIPPNILQDVKHLPIEELENIFIPDKKSIIFECKCCYCECFEKDKILCSEGHEFCKECLSSYVTDRITSGDYKLHCMANTECEGFYNHKLLETILDPKLYANYVEKEFQEIITLANIENLFTCPKCCIYSAIIDGQYIKLLREPKFTCLNPSCKYISCLKCKRDFHGNNNCNYIKRDQGVRKTIEEILTKNRARTCPKCNKEFIRVDGCNKMTCSCKTRSCYICRAKIKDYSHFQNKFDNKIAGGKCPLYTNEKEIEKMSFDNALNEIFNTYKHDIKKIIGEVYPILLQLEKEHKALIDKKFSTALAEQDRSENKLSEISKIELQENEIVSEIPLYPTLYPRAVNQINKNIQNQNKNNNVQGQNQNKNVQNGTQDICIIC